MTDAGSEGSSTGIEIVFFDAGDTLLGPHPSFPELFSRVCREHGYDVSPEVVVRVRSELAPNLIDLAEETGVDNPSFSSEASRSFWGYLYMRFLTALEIADSELAAALLERFSTSSSYMLFGDVLATLRRLHDGGYRLGLISNFEQWLAERLIELEVGQLFDVTVISGFVKIEKPDPAIYELALQRARVEPARAVHVGDSMSMDVEPAVSVGMHAVLLDRAGRFPDSKVPRIESLEELPGVVAKLG
ncbi:MAG: HAD-IA family hydrolase [Actinobacteria bacterium]|nr:HAD-IA family hydrolase [Actinomycetota bacterium]